MDKKPTDSKTPTARETLAALEAEHAKLAAWLDATDRKLAQPAIGGVTFLTRAAAAALLVQKAEVELQASDVLAKIREIAPQAQLEKDAAIAAACAPVIDQLNGLVKTYVDALQDLAELQATLAAKQRELAVLGGSGVSDLPWVGDIELALAHWRERQATLAESTQRAINPKQFLLDDLNRQLARALGLYHDAEKRRGLFSNIDTRDSVESILKDYRASLLAIGWAFVNSGFPWPSGLPFERPRDKPITDAEGRPPKEGSLAYLEMQDERHP